MVPAQQAPAGEAPAQAPATAGDLAPAGNVPPVSPTAGMRGVLFRVIPPQPTLLPAETAQAQSPAANADDPASASPPPAPMRASYLLATIHFGTPEEQGIDYAQLERTLAEVETFVNEANLDEAWKPEYDGYRWLPPEQPLSAMVGQDDFRRKLAPVVQHDVDLLHAFDDVIVRNHGPVGAHDHAGSHRLGHARLRAEQLEEGVGALHPLDAPRGDVDHRRSRLAHDRREAGGHGRATCSDRRAGSA